MDQAPWVSIMELNNIVHTCLKIFLRREQSCLRMGSLEETLRQRFMCKGFIKVVIPGKTGQRARETGREKEERSSAVGQFQANSQSQPEPWGALEHK